MSSKQQLTVHMALIATAALCGAASSLHLESMWGVNHLAFTGNWPGYLFWVAAVLVCLVAFVRWPEARLDSAWTAVDRFLWGGGRTAWLVTTAAFMALFIVFRIETCLVGDGCTWLENYGRPHVYLHKWTEPGSAYLVRWLQAIQGEYTIETAKISFQALSILCGGIFVYNAISIIGFLLREKHIRIFGLTTLLLSGSILLFFGYIEFYPMSWAAAALFLNTSLRYIDKPRRYWLVLLTYVLAVLMHLQSLYFLPGLILLFIQRIPRRSLRMWGYRGLGAAAIAGVVAMAWLYHSRVDIEVLILPFFTGRPYAPDYTVFSLPHLRNLANLVMLVLPGSVGLLLAWLFARREWRSPTVIYLSALSVGSLTFALLFGAAITMGRDWDLFSLSLLAPVLLMLYQVDREGVSIRGKTVLVYCLTAFLLTCSFVAGSVDTGSAERRAYSVLTNYNKNAWLIYGRYFWLKGDERRYAEIEGETYERFPDYALTKDPANYDEHGQDQMKLEVAEKVVAHNPYDPVYLRHLANAYVQLGRYVEAEKLYLRAVRLKPYDARLKNELGQLYIKKRQLNLAVKTLREAYRLDPAITAISESMALAYINLGHLDSALAVADTLFLGDPYSPGGHLINLVISLHSGDTAQAAEHYEAFRQSGRTRSDYWNIVAYYQYLAR